MHCAHHMSLRIHIYIFKVKKNCCALMDVFFVFVSESVNPWDMYRSTSLVEMAQCVEL